MKDKSKKRTKLQYGKEKKKKNREEEKKMKKGGRKRGIRGGLGSGSR